ncbi:DNA repair protein RecN [Brevinematales bacterium NS]|nr:DNA repair protein RecN [Brevinematales bacterium NS]
MIQRLAIRNYAIIDHLEVEFPDGFIAFTGETGAGKSIILGALGLLTGERADTSVIRTGSERAIVEGEFILKEPALKDILKNLEIDTSDTLLIRREIVSDGRGRVFINGLQEPLSKLEAIGEYLVDFHGQHDHQLLLQQKVHLDMLDRYGNLFEEREEVKNLYQKFTSLLATLADLQQDESRLEQEKIFWETAVEDIAGAKLYPEEENELTEEVKRLENGEKIAEAFSLAHQVLYEQDGSVLSKLQKILHPLADIAGMDKTYQEIYEILDTVFTQTQEAASLIREARDTIDFDPEKMNSLIERLETIKDLKRKYKKNTVQELLDYLTECQDRLRRFSNRAEEIASIQKEIEETQRLYSEKALALSKKRQEVATNLAKHIGEELATLGMDKATFIVDIKYVRDENSPLRIQDVPIKISESGIDRVEFFMTTNPGEEPKPLRKIASGGEISRVMLALKSIFSRSDVVETLIFDEIDVGIGGLTANQVATKMRQIASHKQLLVITHLPQIASAATTHFKVLKEVVDNKTYTRLIPLGPEERIPEIARMLGGEDESAKAHAQEMIKRWL